MFDQHENFRSAILRKKARVCEIEVVLSRPMCGAGRYGWYRVSESSRLRLQEERLHLIQAIHELETEDERLKRLKARPVLEPKIGFVYAGAK